MTPRDLFGVGVRLTGLVACLYGANSVLRALSLTISMRGSFGGQDSWLSMPGGSMRPMITAFLMEAAVWVAAGLFLLLRSRAVVEACYPGRNRELEAEEPVT